jgi:putative addiction module killer protein
LNTGLILGRATGVYLGRDGDMLVILLTGGTKKRQQRDIQTAAELWKAYRHNKRSKR